MEGGVSGRYLERLGWRLTRSYQREGKCALWVLTGATPGGTYTLRQGCRRRLILAGKEDDEFHFGYVEFDMFLGIQVEMPSEAAGHRIVALRSQTWAGRWIFESGINPQFIHFLIYSFNTYLLSVFYELNAGYKMVTAGKFLYLMELSERWEMDSNT